MIFTVIWRPLATGKLATLWMNAPDRKALSAAANKIDELLKTDPESRGEPRGNNRRVLIVPPLIVAFQVKELDRIVEVLSVQRYTPDPQIN
jgi:hypothetical protein